MSTRTSERLKYERMWEVPRYRKNSPGLIAVGDFLKHNPIGHTLVDLGCGTGRAGLELSKSFSVVLFDIAGNAIDSDNTLPFIQGCLWEDVPKADIGYCCDVLEHIPTDKVDRVLDNLFENYQQVFMRIFLTEDTCGKEIGETLHLTVKPFEWWDNKIRARWGAVDSKDATTIGTWYASN